MSGRSFSSSTRQSVKPYNAASRIGVPGRMRRRLRRCGSTCPARCMRTRRTSENPWGRRARARGARWRTPRGAGGCPCARRPGRASRAAGEGLRGEGHRVHYRRRGAANIRVKAQRNALFPSTNTLVPAANQFTRRQDSHSLRSTRATSGEHDVSPRNHGPLSHVHRHLESTLAPPRRSRQHVRSLFQSAQYARKEVLVGNQAHCWWKRTVVRCIV